MTIALAFLVSALAQKEGLAAKYPGDIGLKNDPAVLLLEDFEEDPRIVGSMKPGGWFDVKFAPGSGVELTDKVPAAAGKRCLQFNLKAGKHSSGHMLHKVKPVDCLYYRYYRMHEKEWQWPKGHASHDVAIYGGRFVRPTDNDLSIDVGSSMDWDTVVRVTTLGQKLGRGWDEWLKARHGTSPFGGLPWNKSQPEKIEPMKWHCVEVMVKLSTPGKEDGAIKLWVNGKLVSDSGGLPLRDEAHPDLLLDLVLLAPHFTIVSPKDQAHWADQVVVATRYIGPVKR